MFSIQRTMNVIGFFKVILIFFIIFDLSVFGERLLWQNEAEINAEPFLRHYNHHKNKQRHIEDVTEGYSRPYLKTNLRHRSHHHRNNHHTTTTTITTTTTSPPVTTTIKNRTPEEHRLRHSNKFYQTFNLNHDNNREKSNVRRYINQSSYPTTTPHNPWKKLVSSTSFNNKPHHVKQSQSARNFYNVSKLMQYRLFDRDGVYTTRPPKIRHPYDVLKVPYRDRVRIKPIKKSFDHNDLWDDSRFMDDENDDIDWISNKRHLKLKSNNRNGKKLRDDYYDEDYYDDEEESDDVDKKGLELESNLKTVQHGFPHKPTALAYDPKDKLMTIGTHSGAIKVFGRPGVEFYGQHSSTTNKNDDLTVQLLEWVPGTGRVLSLTRSNELVLWEPAGAMLVPIKSLSFDGKLKKVSSLCCSILKDVVWIGTEGGNVYQFDLKTFTMKESVIYHDVVLEHAIESVKQLPNNYNQLLIVYNRGLCVIWDLEKLEVVRSFISPGHGQSVGVFVHQDGEHFTWYHADGSFATWDLDSAKAPENEKFVPYGDDPCKSINGLAKGLRGDNEIVIFSGGMPRSAYGDHQTVSVHCDDSTKICLDFTSKVIDFFVTFNDDHESQAEVLIVLLEEELCAFDLTDPALRAVKTPYLHSVHTSAVTCNHLVSQVTAEVYEKIIEAGQQQQTEFSDLEWPVTGGHVPENENSDETNEYEILLTGHEDGSVRFWDCTGVVLKPILQFKTALLFGSDLETNHNLNESQDQLAEGDPPFRKAGLFDPYSDDPRYGVKKIAMCPKTGQIIVAGTAGYIVIASLDHRIGEGPMKLTTMNLVSDRDGFVWKGHDPLTVKASLLDEEVPPIEDGVQVVGILQVLPPAAINCLALQSSWNLVAAGTSHGLVVFDYVNHHPVLHECTLNPKDLSGAGETLSRRKSFKKTLRESFRRLRRGRSTRNVAGGASAAPTTIETRPVERQIEARPTDDAMGSMVRCLTFAQTYIINNNTTTPTLWSGTTGLVYVYILHIPPKQINDTTPAEQRKPITGQLTKSIHLKHNAPIVGITIFDNAGYPLEMSPSAPGKTSHRVVVATEEQFKIYSLPLQKSNNNVVKYKLTALEGVRVRRMSFARFSCIVPPSIANNVSKSPSKTDNTAQLNTSVDPTAPITHTEVGLLCLTNAGDCLVFSIPELKRQINAAAVRREDISGISSLCFTNYGEALYMMSSSELQRISLSATKVVALEGTIDLDPLYEEEQQQNAPELERKSDLEIINEGSTVVHHRPLNVAIDALNGQSENLTNGDSSPNNNANETVSSSIGDVTVDSVRDHLNSTVTTLHTTTTEEIVGRLSVLSTQTNNTITSLNMKEIPDINLANFKDLSPIGDTTQTSQSSVVIKSVITSMTHGTQQNGDTAESVKTTTTTTRKESVF